MVFSILGRAMLWLELPGGEHWLTLDFESYRVDRCPSGSARDRDCFWDGVP